jgi:short-subunit dehydrogenase
MDLKGKVVLITGASSGFGEDAAVLFAREGAIVILAARRAEKLRQIVDQIHQAGGAAEAMPLDIANAEQCRALVENVIAKHGRIDVLFNHAGVGRLNFLDQLDLQNDILPQIETNFIGLIQLTRFVLPVMIQQKSGHIINMSSVAGWIAPALYSIYAATKFGVRGFTDALRQEVAPFGIHVSGIYPGPATTEFGQHIGLTRAKRRVNVPSLFYMTSQHVAEQVVKITKHPRNTLILPWYFNVLTALNFMLPGLVNWIVIRFFVIKQRAQVDDQN